MSAKAFYIPPETNTEESGYFSLCEGLNGKIYVGTAAYGRNSYLVEFDPATEKMRVVFDTHKLVGLPLTPTGYAAQSKLHTRNFVGPSGKIYVGSKQGYPNAAEKEALKRGEKIPVYRGGYVMAYDPATETAENFGMPMPLTDQMIAAGKTEGQGVIDVTADEARGLLYVITCEEQHWMLYDMKTKKYRDLGTIMRDQPNTLIDSQGRGTAITADYQVARFDPATDKVTVDPLLVEGQPFLEYVGEKCVHPDWRITPDGKTAYLQTLNDLRMFRVDLSGACRPAGGRRESGEPHRGHETRFARLDLPRPRRPRLLGGAHRQYHRLRQGLSASHRAARSARAGQWKTWESSRSRIPTSSTSRPAPIRTPTAACVPSTAIHTLPDGTLTPLHVILGQIVTRDGTIYATVLAPFTLLKIESIKAIR